MGPSALSYKSLSVCRSGKVETHLLTVTTGAPPDITNTHQTLGLNTEPQIQTHTGHLKVSEAELWSVS